MVGLVGNQSIFIYELGDYIFNIVRQYGVYGLGIGTFLESLGIPAAGVVLQLTSGSLIISGNTTFLVALAISTIGLTLGSIASYYLGYFGVEVFHRFHPKKSESSRSRLKDFLTRHGGLAIFLAQLFGPARTWISIPAGVMRLEIKRFIIFTFLGGLFYCAIAINLSIYATRLLSANIDELLDVISIPIVIGFASGILLTLALWRSLLIKRDRARQKR